MPIQKSNVVPEKGFTLVQTTFLRDENLSLKAKGLLTVLIALPPDWQITIKGLEEICVENKNTISSIINELISAGYLRRKQNRENGRFGASVYEIIVESKSECETSSSDEACLPCGDSESLPISNFSLEIGYEDTGAEKSRDDNLGGENLSTIKYLYNNYYNNKYNNNIIFNNQSINHCADKLACKDGQMDGRIDYRALSQIIQEKIGAEALASCYDESLVDDVINLIVDVIACQVQPVVINGMLIPGFRLQQVFSNLDYSTVNEVLRSVSDNSYEIQNMRKYLLTCLYTKASMARAETSLAVMKDFGW